MTVSVEYGTVGSEPGGGFELLEGLLPPGSPFLPHFALTIAFTCVEGHRPAATSGTCPGAIARRRPVLLSVRAREFEWRRCRAHDLPDAARCWRVPASSQECGDCQRGRALLFPWRHRFPVHPARRLALFLSATGRAAARSTQQLARSILLKKDDSLERKLVRGGSRHQDICASVAARNSHPLHECRATCAKHVRI